jgi:hypothetical protein
LISVIGSYVDVARIRESARKRRYLRGTSTPTESVSTRLKLLVCLARTGVKTPVLHM